MKINKEAFMRLLRKLGIPEPKTEEEKEKIISQYKYLLEEDEEHYQVVDHVTE